ncbi:hypothetical protein FRB94_011014 [Tulasnella sp. JGI-2019a]|nr:hypothetical protein FRB94_011014 [Tulasnella sp. JGI-2019a]
MAGIKLTPGVRYLLTIIIPQAIIPATVVYAGTYPIISNFTPIKNPYLINGICLATLFGVANVFGALHALNQQRLARQLGAVPVPAVRGRLHFLGNVDVVIKMVRGFKGYAHGWLGELESEWGSFYNLRMLGGDTLVTTSPDLFKQVIVTDFPIWIKGEDVFKMPMQGFLGDGVFNSNGSMWKFHRSMTRPFFAKDKIIHFDTFSKHADEAIAKINERDGEAIDFQDIASRFTMDSGTSFLFGESVNSMSAPLAFPFGAKNPDKTQQSTNSGHFPSAFRDVLEVCGFRLLVAPDWPLWEFMEDKVEAKMKTIHEYIDPIVQRALGKHPRVRSAEESSDPLANSDENQTLLDHLASVMDDQIMIRDELLNILLAARDTTAHAITAVMYFLATHPTIMARLREEINDVVGPVTTPTFVQVKDMKYLRAIINETLRLMPSVPANMKQSTAASVWTDPATGVRYYIPKGANVSLMTILMQRGDAWGPDSTVFDPDRWIDERNKKYYLANPFIFLPFHGGPRMCLGQQFALNETSFFVTRLLQSFDDISFAPDAFAPGTLPPQEWKGSQLGRKSVEKVWPMSHLTMYFKGGLWLRMRGSRTAQGSSQ